MAFPRRFKPLLERSRADVAEPSHAWVAYAVCAAEPQSCQWRGWVLEGLFSGAEVLISSDHCLKCPVCAKPLFRTEVEYRLELSADQTPPLIDGRDYTTAAIDYFSDIEGLNSETYYLLCGIWDETDGTEDAVAQEFSWGRSRYRPNCSLVVDLGLDRPLLRYGRGACHEIERLVTRSDNLHELHLRPACGGRRSPLTVHTDEAGRSIWFDDNGILPSGPDRRYLRIGGPGMRRTTARQPDDEARTF